MRRTVGVLLLAFVLIGANFVFTSASAEDDSDSDNGTTMHLTVKTVDETEIDLGKKGPSVGDRFLFVDDVYKDDKLVGSNYGDCVLMSFDKDSADIQCVLTVWIDDKGQMTLQGVFTAPAEDVPDPFKLAITGGTDDFRGADGEVEVDLKGNGDADLTVHLD